MTRLGDSPRQPLVMNAGSPHAQWIPIHRHGLVTLARMLKEAALEVFQTVFCEIPLTEKALEHSGFGTPFYGLSVMYFSIAHPVDTPFHPPITRLMKLHPDSAPTIGHLSVLFAATLRERVGKVTKFDLDEVRRKYQA